jgi:hypothetical protein
VKKVLFFLSGFLVSLILVNGQTNVYHPFPTHDAIWREYSGYYPIPNFVAFEYIITGDTLILDKDYHKILRISANYAIGYNGVPILDSLGGTYEEYYGAFREDTILKQVFFIPYWYQYEELLYDFNLQLGDSLSGLNGGQYTYVMTVDSVIVGTEYRRRLGIGCPHFFNYPYVFLIEGIGSTFGFVEPINIPIEGVLKLYCFTQNGISLYQSADPHSTCDFLAVKEIESNKPVGVSPNPFTTSTQITLDKTYHNISLSVYDIQGKLMLQKQHKDCNQIQLNRNGLGNGMYFLKLTLDERWVETGKIVISE